MGMKYGNDDGGQAHDGYPKKTSSALAVKDSSKKNQGGVKEQADSLIDLVLGGEDPTELMDNTIAQIKEQNLEEGGAGPYPIGSRVKVNTGGTFEKVGGGTIAIPKGAVVSVVNPFLGEKGTDKLVLLADGKTKALVPLAVLGESEGWLSEQMGPKGHEVPGATGKPSATPSKPVGSSLPSDLPAAQKKGSMKPAAQTSSTAVGDAAPTDDKSAQSKGSSTPAGLNPSKALEHHNEVLQALDMMLENCTDAEFRTITNFRKLFDESKDMDLLNKVHPMLFSEDEQYSISDLNSIMQEFSEQDDNGNGNDKNGKKKTMPNPFNKKKDKKDQKPPMKMGSEDESVDEKGDKKPFPGAPPFGSKKKDKEKKEAQSDHQSPQGKPGKNPTPPGLKESEVKSAMSSIFSRIDEDVQSNLR